MSDLLERLRVKGPIDRERINHTVRRLHVERLEAAQEIERLRAAIQKCVNVSDLSREVERIAMEALFSEPKSDE